ncbi:DUF4476 domain-containing protein [Pedobacter changchengzhani]|uniref:DUF4476 domain-containing protein n=1 Tax=Pedobacter changchengzhani TaxID=2529274 RepID=A0A4R5MN46_9SPHI|nr:DUF4476 domain-containing protein [Pedobacter changchengzhani]TDG37210.1 DUF4476 domain-containing protein [Pedobacter changchengzhani]
MKKIILLIVMVFYTTLSFAQKNRNRAEVFLQINDAGTYTVYLDNEFVGSENGRFRFYDVYNSNPVISIYRNNIVIFKKNIAVVQDQRLILTYAKNMGMRVIKQLNIYRNVEYALDDFDNYNNNTSDNAIDQNYTEVPKSLSPEAFQQLNKLIKDESFDDGKTKLLQVASKSGNFTTEQARILLKYYSFDNNRLVGAKAIYKSIIDPQNYFTLADLFTFSSNKSDFLSFLNSK